MLYNLSKWNQESVPKSNIKLIFSICKWNGLIGDIGILVLSHHLYSLCCMSYIQMILSPLRLSMVSIPTIKDNTCFQLKPNVIVSVYYCCVHWDWGRQWALLSHCDRHCERHMWDHYGSSCWCTNGLHILWGMQLYGLWCCRYCITHVLTPSFAFEPSQVVSYAGF